MKFIKSLFKSLPLAKQLIDIKRDIQVTKNLHEQQLVILQETFKLLLKRDQKYNSSHLIHSEAQIYSQNGEDGIIEEIFERIGVTNKFFIEIGSSNGLENNTALLLLSDWQGIWVEGSQDSCRQAHKHWTEYVEMNFLKIVANC